MALTVPIRRLVKEILGGAVSSVGGVWPVPLRFTICGVLGTAFVSSVTVTLALLAPLVVGANAIVKVQLPLAATALGRGEQDPAPVFANTKIGRAHV